MISSVIACIVGCTRERLPDRPAARRGARRSPSSPRRRRASARRGTAAASGGAGAGARAPSSSSTERAPSIGLRTTLPAPAWRSSGLAGEDLLRDRRVARDHDGAAGVEADREDVAVALAAGVEEARAAAAGSAPRRAARGPLGPGGSVLVSIADAAIAEQTLARRAPRWRQLNVCDPAHTPAASRAWVGCARGRGPSRSPRTGPAPSGASCCCRARATRRARRCCGSRARSRSSRGYGVLEVLDEPPAGGGPVRVGARPRDARARPRAVARSTS